MAIIKIETTDYSYLLERCAKMNKRLARYGYAPVNERTHEREWNTYERHCVNDEGMPSVVRVRVLVHKIELEIPIDRVGEDGTQFIAKLEFGSEEAGNRVYKADETCSDYDETLFEMIQSQKGSCDHCNKNRKRNSLFIFKKEEKLYTIGATCAKDWYGSDIENFLSISRSFTSFCDEEERGRRDWNARRIYEVNLAIQASIASIQIRGFVGSKYDNSTANEASETVNWITNPQGRLGHHTAPTLVSEMQDGKYVEQMAGLQDFFLNEYKATDLFSTNLRSSVIDSTCSYAMAAIAAQKYLASINIVEDGFGQNTVNAVSQLPQSNFEWLGDEGEKVVLEGEIAMTRTIDSDFGVSYLIKVQGQKGVATWFSSNFNFLNCNFNDLKTGTKVRIAGKIKRLDTYKETKQSILTRCKLEMLEEEVVNG